MDALQRQYLPMSETMFYILLSLTEARHGYGIMQYVEELTDKRIRLGAGTLYGSLSRMEKDGVIVFVREDDRRKTYQATEDGRALLKLEIARISELHRNAMTVWRDRDE
ncbi:PadR family transcriptional regulator [Cohnella nanjingensis]|uniref:PadR family transcriptional regulator n=2 Tax=Cohnella nanjingensis TaxID=1387779 RepID=A0A7X0VEK6_9BACL|nr:PadR family transcriptional regulator [Cohnella nanjingensis]MBB6670358.1 PadR family transcriptional regulator [Cohnella nanjingensis]